MTFQADPNHWAYRDGASVARTKNKVQRGIMSFGLGMAATSLDEENARQWIVGYDTTEELMKTEVTVEAKKADTYNIWTGEKLDF